MIVQPFMRLWMGGAPDSLLPNRTVVLLLCYFYVYGIRRVVLMAKDSAGLYRQDQWFAVGEAVLNIVMSVLLAWRMRSIDGIILANLLSMLIVPLWTQPYLVYKHVLEHRLASYYVRYVFYFAMTAGLYLLTAFLADTVMGFVAGYTANLFVELLVRAVLCAIVPNVLNLLVFFRTAEMRDMRALFCGVLKRGK